MTSLIQAAEVIHDIETGEFLEDDSIPRKQWWEKLGSIALVVLGLATASIVCNLLAMVFFGQAVIYAMGIIALLLAPLVMKRQIEMV